MSARKEWPFVSREEERLLLKAELESQLASERDLREAWEIVAKCAWSGLGPEARSVALEKILDVISSRRAARSGERNGA